MTYYPILIDSKQIKALVIGAGEVGLRKIDTLLLQGVESIDVYDIALAFEDFSYKESKYIAYFQEEFNIDALKKYNLVFIASNNQELNSYYVQECKKRSIFCNVITNPHEGHFSLPALIQRGDLLLTLSTNGQSPALTKALKADLENFIQDSYVELCDFLGRLRPQILKLSLDSKENTKIFRTFVTEPYKDDFINFFSNKSKENVEKVEKCIQSCFSKEVQKIVKETLNCIEL